MPSTRPYDNRLRQEQAQATADRILAALCELLVDERPASVSIPAVAKRAGVSVRTVYSHFPTKDDLFEALSPYVNRTYFDAFRAPAWDPDGPVRDMARIAAPAFAPVIPLFVALARAGIDDDDHATARNDQRLEHMAQLVRHDLPDLDDGSRRQLATLLGAVVSWPVVQRLLRAGEDADSAGELLAWMADALVAHAEDAGLPCTSTSTPARRTAEQAGGTGRTNPTTRSRAAKPAS